MKIASIIDPVQSSVKSAVRVINRVSIASEPASFASWVT